MRSGPGPPSLLWSQYLAETEHIGKRPGNVCGLTKQMFSCLLSLLPAATLGALEFSLLYDQENSNLQCTIIRAKVRGDPWGCSGFLRDEG